ncbi:hypothetical protein QQ045_026943 [Rhodiola kirilowii]
MAELMKNPDKMDKAREEVDRIIGQERWTAPFTNITPTTYVAIEDCHIKHYHIPKGTLVLINTWTHGAWVGTRTNGFELLPFGSGRQMCPGYSLGMKMIQSSLANLIDGFNWTLPLEMKTQDLDMEEVYGLSTTRKHPLVAVFEPRHPPHLYTCPSSS